MKIMLHFFKILSRNILADTLTMLGVNYHLILFFGRGMGLVLSRKFPDEE